MLVRRLVVSDLASLKDYLQQHGPYCMFMLNNLQKAGILYQGQPYQGEYWGYFDPYGQVLRGVFVHYCNGNLMFFADHASILGELVKHFCQHVSRAVAGVLGEDAQAQLVIDILGLPAHHFQTNYQEDLYSLSLYDLLVQALSADQHIRPASDVPLELLVSWLLAYRVEALAANEDAAHRQAAREHAIRLKSKDAWVLLELDVPVSLAAFNARLETCVQLGPVWTPPVYRSRGLARGLISGILELARKQGVTQSVLFTHNPSAVRAYLALGFRQIGQYRLALLAEPVNL